MFYSREMADKQLGVILYRILRVKCDLNRNRKSHLWFSEEIDQNLGERLVQYIKTIIIMVNS